MRATRSPTGTIRGPNRRSAEVRRVLQAPDAEALFTFNGTGANVVRARIALAAVRVGPVHPVRALLVDEAGAPSRFIGFNVGALTPRTVRLNPHRYPVTAACRRR